MKVSYKNDEDKEGTREIDGEMGEEKVIEVETRVIVESTDSDTRIVSDIGEGEGEIKIIVESTKIREGGEEEIGKEGEGRREDMKEREAGMAREESRRHTIGSLSKLLHSTGALSSSDLLGSFFGLLFSLHIL